MKKLIATLAFAATLAFNVAAVEYGAVLSTTTDFKFSGGEYDTCGLEQSETLTPYIKVPFAQGSYFAAEFSVQHKLTDTLGIDVKAQNACIIDLTLLKFSKTLKFDNSQTLEISLGRMMTSDSTGIVFSQTNDGAFIRYANPNVEVRAYGGYSGLQNIKNVQVLSSKGEVFSLPDEKKIYDFSAPYIVALASVAAPYLFANQTISLEFMGAFASGGPNKLPDDEDNRIYATFMINGPVIPALFYNASVTMQTTDFSAFGLLAKANATYYLDVKDATVGFATVYASGKNGGLEPFVGFTKQKACYSASEPGYSGILKMALTGSIVPVKAFLVSAECGIVFNTSEKSEYYGFQAALSGQWNIFSDLRVALGANTFVGKEKTDNKTEIILGAAIAF